MTTVGNDTVLEGVEGEACAVSARKLVRVGRNEEDEKITSFGDETGFPKRSNGRESSAKPSKREE